MNYDLIIIGAGPAGISAAYEAQKINLNYLVLEKNLIGNTIYQYPVGLTVFSTVNELELQPNTLFPAREKPTREELLSYYTRFVLENNLNIQWEEAVTNVEKIGENHFKITSEKGEYEAANVLFAFGAMQYPRHLGVKGEDLPKVHHLFTETYPYVRKNAMVVGGGNSAGEAALFNFRDRFFPLNVQIIFQHKPRVIRQQFFTSRLFPRRKKRVRLQFQFVDRRKNRQPDRILINRIAD